MQHDAIKRRVAQDLQEMHTRASTEVYGLLPRACLLRPGGSLMAGPCASDKGLSPISLFMRREMALSSPASLS